MTTPNLPLAEELGLVYARMSGWLLSEQTVQTALELITSLSLDTIPGAIGAGVTIVDPEHGSKESAAATSEMVANADSLQYELNEGPCLTAWATGEVQRIDDMQSETRWPNWITAVNDLGYGLSSTLSAPMISNGRRIGATKVYGVEKNVFSERSMGLLARFGAQAAILLANVQSLNRAERLSDDLQRALHARNVIAWANGIIMHRDSLTQEQAFVRLASDARIANRDLVDEATLLIASVPHEHE